MRNQGALNSGTPMEETPDDPQSSDNPTIAVDNKTVRSGDQPKLSAKHDSERPAWLSDPRLKKLDPRFVQLERLGGLIFVALVAVAAAVVFTGVTIAKWPPRWWTPLLALAALVVLGAMTWFAYYWPAVVHRHYRYLANQEGLQIYRGVYWRSVINVPRARIQHSDVRQGPLQHRFGLGKLVVHTAGSHHPSIELDGLSREEALAVRDVLTAATAEEKGSREG